MKMEKSLSEYMKLSEKLEIEKHEKKIKLAFLSSFTITGLPEILKTKCNEKQISCQTYLGSYNQYPQEILNLDSSLYRFNPDLTFLIFDLRNIFGEHFFYSSDLKPSQKKEFIIEKINELKNLFEVFSNNSNSKLVVSNLNVPFYSSYGIAEQNSEFGFHEMISYFNSLLKELVKKSDNIFLLDFNNFVSRYGEENIFNYRNYFFGDIKISLNLLPFFGEYLMSFVIAFLGISKKCVVLDLDNTLWGGIIGEDGFDNIALGPQPPGNTFYEFQKFLKGLSKRGILLAINSRNNFEDAIKVIREHPFMILRENDFSCIVINWGNKVQNLQEIAKKLNIGIDSLVFFDDDPVNREFVKKELPEVTVPELPKDSSEFSNILLALNDFSSFEITKEDVKRKEMYLHQKKRLDLEQSSSNLEDFLKTLDIRVTIEKANNFTIPRISQLTLKTNQFNLTTKRYQKEDIEKFNQSENYLVCSAKVTDKFGDNGLTGVCIIEKQKDTWIIDTFLLSCRIMGREIEKIILNYIIKEAKQNNVKTIRAKFIPTEKNFPIENFLPSCGFKKINDYWEFEIGKLFSAPEFITLVET